MTEQESGEQKSAQGGADVPKGGTEAPQASASASQDSAGAPQASENAPRESASAPKGSQAQKDTGSKNGVAKGSPTARHKNKGRTGTPLQDRFLTRLRHSNGEVAITLSGSGVQVVGRLTGFDSFCLTLMTEAGEVLVYKQGIATVVRTGGGQSQGRQNQGGQRKKNSTRTAKGGGRGREGRSVPDVQPATASLGEMLRAPAGAGATPAPSQAEGAQAQETQAKETQAKEAQAEGAQAKETQANETGATAEGDSKGGSPDTTSSGTAS